MKMKEIILYLAWLLRVGFLIRKNASSLNMDPVHFLSSDSAPDRPLKNLCVRNISMAQISFNDKSKI